MYNIIIYNTITLWRVFAAAAVYKTAREIRICSRRAAAVVQDETKVAAEIPNVGTTDSEYNRYIMRNILLALCLRR